METPEPDYAWSDTGVNFKTLLSGSAHVLNVTSLRWLNETIYEAEGGPVWSHQVVVVYPPNIKYYNISTIYLASVDIKKNGDPIGHNAFNPDLVACDTIAHQTGAPCVVAYQIPSNPMVFKSDPEHKSRREDD